MTGQADAPTACILCGKGLVPVLSGLWDDRFGAPGNYAVCRCEGCGLEQTAPRPSPENLKTLYEAHYNFGGSGRSAYARLRQRLFDSFAYRAWLTLDGDVSFHARRGTGRLLDVGCNEGRGLAIYRRNGHDVEGLELNEQAAAVARRDGFVVHTEPLEKFQPAELYDVVVLSNVLEHSLQPSGMLGEVARILKPGGSVWISCPNAASWQRRLFGRHWINWHVPFHIVHFSPQALGALLRDTGFRVASTGQASPALWFAQSLIARLFSRPGRPTRQLRSSLLVGCLTLLARGLLFPWLWAGNRIGRGDCLVVVAKKP